MSETLNILVHERCRFLLSNSLFANIERDPDWVDQGPFWCSHTQGCLGPDGQLCDDHECQPGRACYDPA